MRLAVAEDLALRRTPTGWLLGGGSVIFTWVALCILFGGVVGASVWLSVTGTSLVVASLMYPLLYGVRLADDVLRFGFRFRRQLLHVSNIASIEIGKVEQYGLRGADVMGMVIVDRQGARHPIPESRYCREARLVCWSEQIRAASPGVEIHQEWNALIRRWAE